MRSKHPELNLVQFHWVVCICTWYLSWTISFEMGIQGSWKGMKDAPHTHRPVNEIVNKVHLESLFVSFSKELSQKIIFLGLVFIATMKLFFHRTSSGAKKKNQQQQWTSVAKNREHSTRGCRAIWEIEEVYACPTNGNHGALRACCILRSRAHWMCLICVRSQAMERAKVAALAENGNK